MSRSEDIGVLTLGARIRAARVEMPRQQWCDAEADRRDLRWSTVERIAAALGCGVGELASSSLEPG